jgi:hypothetical protein
MANGNLIQGARRLGQSKRFVDYGKVLGEAMKPTQGMLLAKQQYFQAVKEKEAKTQNFIDNLSDLDITKIPTGLRNQVTDFLTTGRQKYYDASEKAANARMGSEEYRNAVREMNTINNSFRNLSGRLGNLQQARTEFIQNYDQGMVSKGNQNYDEALSILGADLNDPNALNLSISESGDIGFIIKGADGQDKIVNEIPNYFNKASNVSNSLAKMSETYNINGQRGIEVTDQILRDNVYRTIGDNRDNIVSLATDSWLGASALINESNIDTELYQGLTGAELLDPANQAALKSYVNDRYYNGIKDAYSSGYGVYNRKKQESERDDTLKPPTSLSELIEGSQVRTYNEYGEDMGINDKSTNRNIAYKITQNYPVGYGFDKLISREAAFQTFRDLINVPAWEDIPNETLKEIIDIETRLPNQEIDSKTLEKLNINGAAIKLYSEFKKKHGNKELFQLTQGGNIVAPEIDLKDPSKVWVMLNQLKMVSKNQGKIATDFSGSGAILDD